MLPTYADIILPLALPKRTYTYSIPESVASLLQPGVRVEVQFGRSKLYSGLVERVHNETPDYAVKPILSVLDEVTVVTPQQFRLWDWMADYYCCTLGEVMSAALPGHLKLTSETKLVFNSAYGDNFSDLDSDEYLVAEALQIQQEITVEDARKILNKKTVFPVVQRLLNKGVLFLREDLQEKFKPRKVSAVRLAEPFRTQPDLLREVFTELSGKERQVEILMAYLALEKRQPFVRKQDVLTKADVSESSLNTLVKKGILEKYDREVSRISGYEDELVEADELSKQQVRALSELRRAFNVPAALAAGTFGAASEPETPAAKAASTSDHGIPAAKAAGTTNVALLYGVTGSGKTRVYVELMREVIKQGGQVLYLLPEIALTTQIINRLQKVFGNEVSVYHSKINTQERVEVWKSAAAGKPIILAARSGLFLPFQNLQLVIVDEEHDSSFKQYDPAPRYHARDTAIFLANIYGAKTLLGTATPSLETWHNAQTGKFGLVEMPERFGGLELPVMETIDLREQMKNRQMQSIFSTPLLENLQKALDNGEQAILFQNRRGYAPMLECQVCGWNAQCRYCDVSLTYHKHTDRLRCHYCGYVQEPAKVCPACGSGKIGLKGFGTEKIEDELKIFLPNARIGRMDLDTAGTKSNLTALLNDFEERRLDILVGTQMVTKGLDFDNVALVGVLGADALTKFPDFRAGERAFQLLTQVAGRAGRKNKRGNVLIQAFDPKHPIVQEVLRSDFLGFVERELKERKEFKYPPYYRLIHIELRHKEPKIVNEAASFYAKILRQKLGDRVLGPVIPNIARIRSYFGQDIMLKLEKSAPVLAGAKALIRHTTEVMLGRPGLSQVMVAVDVDPV
ncbi:MAG: primosomal protein N' [Phycisphaerae bacterium]|nr:primosomal protein N' [Saprospiraceae bacterium]